jgi:hypothetical protein
MTDSRWIAFIPLSISIVGFGLGVVLWQMDEATFRGIERSVSFLDFRNEDLPWFGLAAIGCAMAVFAGAERWRSIGDGLSAFLAGQPNQRQDPLSVRWLVALAVAVFAVCALGAAYLHQAYAYSLDEFMVGFQAAVFRQGHLLAELPGDFNDRAQLLQPYFVFHDLQHALWGAHYRPVFAALWALFSLAGSAQLLNPMMAAGSIVLVWLIARDLFPARPDAKWVAAILLASSPQFLVMATSGFSWPAHLFFNLVWLYLFLQDTPRAYAAAACVGFLAVGLHQVHAHLLFVAPFLMPLLSGRSTRRLSVALGFAGAYILALLVWVYWHEISLVLEHGAAAFADINWLRPDYIQNFLDNRSRGDLALFDSDLSPILMTYNVWRLFGWVNIAAIGLMFIAVRYWKDMPPVIRLAFVALALNAAAYAVLMPNQMHGWGYRYFHGHLGLIALIAAAGWVRLTGPERGPVGSAGLARVVICLTLFTLVVGLPLRAYQVAAKVAPKAAAHRFVRALPADVVMVDTGSIWFGIDLVRNDPFLRDGPLVVSVGQVRAEDGPYLCRDNRVAIVTYDDIKHLNVLPTVRREPQPMERKAYLKAHLATLGCDVG